MNRLGSFSICFLAFTIGATTAGSFIKPCKYDDKDCLKSSIIAATPHFIAGIPELGVPPADPIVLSDIRVDDTNLKLGFRNLKVTGIGKCNFVDATRDIEKSTVTLVEECPLSATGQYDLNGKLLFIQAEGDGDFDIKTDNVKIEVVLKLKDIEKDGVKHWKITGFDYKYDFIEKVYITLHNLFGGDETRAKPIQEVIQNSSAEIIKELGDPIIRELLAKAVDIVNKYFKAVPASELEIS